MSRTARFLACASFLVLSACATAGSQHADLGYVGTPEEGAGYGLYLAGHAALNGGDSDAASAYFAAAAKASGSQPVKEEAFYAAILAGDMTRAALLAPSADTGSPGALRMARLVTAVDTLADGKGRQSLAALSGEPIGYPHRAAAALLKPWAAAAAGDMATATAEPELKSDRLAFTLGTLNRALLLEQAKRYDDAETLLKTMAAQDASGSLFTEAYGLFLERRGRVAEALAVYDKGLQANPSDGDLMASRQRAATKGKPPALPTARSGAAQALLGAAAGAMLTKQADLSLVYLRLSLRLEPKSDEAWMMLGDMMSVAGDRESARAAYAHVAPGSAAFVEARTRTIWTYQGASEQAVALALARDTVRLAPASSTAQTTLAEVLRVNKQYAESAEILDKVISAQGARADWRLYYLRAIALDKAGRWPEAERDLKQGLVLKPDEGELLNYLGYTWIVRGERLDEALGMVQRAAISEPNSGAVIDSLGWAYFQLGQYDKAVENLERASQMEPADAEINTHLGDAYWKNGRRIEAQFQWRKVLATMKPEAELKADLEKRLSSGLDSVSPPIPAKVAGR